jgi:Tfp pilus assembly protein PilV
MILKRLRRDQRGTTLAEMVIGLSLGTLVMLGLTTMVLQTMQTTSKVTHRVDATQRSRLVLTRLMDELHSSCISPKLAPIQKESTNTTLNFTHANGSAVSPVPTLSVVSLSGENLTQSDYAKEGSPANWVLKSTEYLMTGVRAIPGRPVFSYYAYSGGALSATALPVPLSELDALRTIQVSVALMAMPAKGVSKSETDPSRVQDSASFRLSSPSYNPNAPSLPCQ